MKLTVSHHQKEISKLPSTCSEKEKNQMIMLKLEKKLVETTQKSKGKIRKGDIGFQINSQARPSKPLLVPVHMHD